MKKLFQESIPVISTFLPKLSIITEKSLLWYREASLLQHCDSNLRLIRQEGIEKNLYKFILCFGVLKGFLFSFILPVNLLF